MKILNLILHLLTTIFNYKPDSHKCCVFKNHEREREREREKKKEKERAGMSVLCKHAWYM